MKRFRIPFMRKFLKEELGQTAVVVALTITAMMGLAGTSVEVGHIYYAYHLLVSSTNAATLAGAQTMSAALLDTTSGAAYTAAVNNMVNEYSSVSGGYNASTFLQGAQITTASQFCSSTMEGAPFNVECQTPPGGSAGVNAIKVTQKATVQLWFGGLIGVRQMNIAAVSTAVMKGGSNIPYNLAIIVDTTGSMATTIKNDKNCTTSQIECAVQGVTAMLENMDPCYLGASCSASTPYVDDVALFVFPAPSTAYSANNYKQEYCSLTGGLGLGSGVKSVPYNFVNVTTGGSQNLNMEMTGTDAGSYEIIPFNDLYKAGDGTKTLSASSALAEAVGYTQSGCGGLSAPGGQGTYYAQVIYAAQEALAQAQNSNSSSKNVMIILSDGDATACGGSNANTAAGACSSGANIVAENNPTCASKGGSCLNGTGTKTTNPSGYNSPLYPSALGECGQAVQAAQAATAAGTLVYTVGFGSETSGCTTDKTYTVASGAVNGAEAWPSGAPYPGSPCNAIAAMASNTNTFYSDSSGGCPALSSANQDFTSLVSIFNAIVTGLTSPRLIPNGTT